MTTTTEHTARHTPIEPCDPRELRVLRGLLSSKAACVWFEGMGIGWSIFTDRRCRVLATWALGHDCQGRPPLVVEALNQADDSGNSMGRWLEFTFGQATPPSPEHRAALEARIEQRLAEAAQAPDSERARSLQRLESAKRGLAKYDEVAAAVAKGATPEGMAQTAEWHQQAMKDACRELAPRWLPEILRKTADYFQGASKAERSTDEGMEYLDKVVAFVRGEIE